MIKILEYFKFIASPDFFAAGTRKLYIFWFTPYIYRGKRNSSFGFTHKGLFKKKCQLSCSFVFCWSLLLFYSEMVHKQWLKVWFLVSQMPILSGRIDFVPFLTTSNFSFPKIPIKYSKNDQKFAMSKNPSNMLFNTCWAPCKKPHFSTRSRSWYTFFWITLYLNMWFPTSK